MRRLIALSLAVPAAVVLAAPPASAGCVTDYLIRVQGPRPQYVSVSVTGPAVYVHDDEFVANTENEIGRTETFVHCVV